MNDEEIHQHAERIIGQSSYYPSAVERAEDEAFLKRLLCLVGHRMADEPGDDTPDHLARRLRVEDVEWRFISYEIQRYS